MKRKDIFAILALLLLHLSFLLLTNFTAWPEMLTYPWLLSKGLLPYKDAIWQYAPYLFYFTEFIFNTIGYSVVSMRIVAYVFILLSDVLLFIIGKKLFKSLHVTILICLFFISWHFIYFGNSLWLETFVLPFYLLSFYYLAAGKSFHAGIFGAGAIFMKQTAGIVYLVGGIYIYCYVKKTD